MKFKVFLPFVALLIICTGFTNLSSDMTQSYSYSKTHDPKKGLCITTRPNNHWIKKLKMLHVSWHYSWGPNLKLNEPANVDFVPMIWKASGNFSKLDNTIRYIKSLAKSGKIHYLLGFNEPDHKDQSNMSVKTAIAAWPILMKGNIPLGSPACAHDTDQWMKDFMSEADSLHYRINFVAVHWYGGANAKNFINYLKKIHNLYHRPIWITEFAVGDWKAKTISENKYSPKRVLHFMKQILPALDKLSFVKRYAWFPANTNSPHLGTSALFKANGSLTKLGEFYARF